MSSTTLLGSAQTEPQFEFPENTWYAIAPSRAIKNKPLGIRRLGQDLVLWRDNNSELVTQSRHCPHRGVDLSLGQVKNGYLECPYHGFQFAPGGQCVAMPCEGKTAHISPAMRIHRYVTQEAHGLIWLWWGKEQASQSSLPWFDSLQDEPRRWAAGEMYWNIPFTRAAESGLIDLHHIAFTHAGVAKLMGMGEAKRLSLEKVKTMGNRILTVGKLHSTEVPLLEKTKPSANEPSEQFHQTIAFSHELLFPNLAMFNFNIGGLLLFVSLTPIDEEKTWAYFRYYATRGCPWLARAIAKAAVWFELKFVQPDDYRLLQSSKPQNSGLTVNHFVPADKTIVEWHRLYRRRQTEQKQRQGF